MVKRGVVSMLPEPAQLAARMRAMSMLDAILEARGRSLHWFPAEGRGESATPRGGVSVYSVDGKVSLIGAALGARDVRTRLPAHLSSTTPVSFAVWSVDGDA